MTLFARVFAVALLWVGDYKIGVSPWRTAGPNGSRLIGSPYAEANGLKTMGLPKSPNGSCFVGSPYPGVNRLRSKRLIGTAKFGGAMRPGLGSQKRTGPTRPAELGALQTGVRSTGVCGSLVSWRSPRLSDSDILAKSNT